MSNFIPKVFLCLLLLLWKSNLTLKLALKFTDFPTPTAVFKDFQGLWSSFLNSRIFKDFQAACEPCNVHFSTTYTYSWSLPQFLNLFVWPTRWTISAGPKKVGLGGGSWLYINVGKEKANTKNNQEKTGRKKRRWGASLLSSVCFCLFARSPWGPLTDQPIAF